MSLTLDARQSVLGLAAAPSSRPASLTWLSSPGTDCCGRGSSSSRGVRNSRGWAWLTRFFLAALLVALLASPAAGAKVHSFAFVRSDGSLDIKGRNYRLYGIHIPQTGRICGRTLRPARCGSRAAIALDFKIQRFVTCEPVSRNRDRSLNAICWVGDEDLAAYLLFHGWALALPGAPFSYAALERIARTQSRGVWGFQADSITFRNQTRR